MTRLVTFLGAALLALSVGLMALFRVFVNERDDARRTISREQAALEAYASEVVRARLFERVTATRDRRADALLDPLVPSEELVLVATDGEVRLPRPVRFNGRTEIDTLDADARSPWMERKGLLDRLDRALDAKDRASIERLVREILAHRRNYVLSPERDISSTLAMLETLVAKAEPDPELVRVILRDGMPERGLQGLMRQLLTSRERFAEADFGPLAARMTSVGRRVGLVTEDFAREAARRATPALEIPKSLAGPALIDGRLAVAPGPEGVAGAVVDLREILFAVSKSLSEAGPDAVEVSLEPAPLVLLDALKVSATSARWVSARDAAEERFLVKLGLLGVCFGLAVALVSLAATLVRREKRLVELKSQFVAAVSHELRTPLASIRLLAEALERRAAEIPKAKDYPTRIVREVDALGSLVENLLSFSRLSKGRWVAKVSVVSLGELVERLQRELESVGKPFELKSNEISGLRVRADPELLALVLINLAKNGLLYNRNELAHVVISGRSEGEDVVIELRDDGVGIPERDWSRVFAEFERIDRPGEKKQKGSGLGLAIAKRAMEAHRGTIRVLSSSEAGTTFRLVFPGGAVTGSLAEASGNPQS
ncbi:MAG: HAMP domain-containing histidine kinase [Deltaproteobacteria bacterium]|nr:HAMP domain-containing histidine kinase [Deltaproteobacteria bacterium]